MAEIPETIVAEISNSWPKQHEVVPQDYIGHKFEKVIRVNREHGYRLVSWRFRQSFTADESSMSETIIAVFEKESE